MTERSQWFLVITAGTFCCPRIDARLGMGMFGGVKVFCTALLALMLEEQHEIHLH